MTNVIDFKLHLAPYRVQVLASNRQIKYFAMNVYQGRPMVEVSQSEFYRLPVQFEAPMMIGIPPLVEKEVTE